MNRNQRLHCLPIQTPHPQLDSEIKYGYAESPVRYIVSFALPFIESLIPLSMVDNVFTLALISEIYHDRLWQKLQVPQPLFQETGGRQKPLRISSTVRAATPHFMSTRTRLITLPFRMLGNF